MKPVHACLQATHPCSCQCRRVYGMEAVYVHDAAALAAVVDPGLFDWEQGGGVLVVTDGPAKGRTIRDEGECLGRAVPRVGRRGMRAGGGCRRWRERAAGPPLRRELLLARARPPTEAAEAVEAVGEAAAVEVTAGSKRQVPCPWPFSTKPAHPPPHAHRRQEAVGGRERVAGPSGHPRGAGRAQRGAGGLGAGPHDPLTWRHPAVAVGGASRRLAGSPGHALSSGRGGTRAPPCGVPRSAPTA